MRYRILCLQFALLTAGVAYGTTPSNRGPTLKVREQRYALVVGNATYQSSPLKTPVNDADDMAAVLQGLRFSVTKLTNASNQEMVEAIKLFGQELQKSKGVGLFYFAGHAVQSKGRNFLIPIGVNISAEEQLATEAVDANHVLTAMAAASERIVILDASRDYPYPPGLPSARRGLAQMNATNRSLIAFAANPGSVAADGMGRNSPYTLHLLQSLYHPDSDIDKVFHRITAAVTRASGNKQVPWTTSAPAGKFYFYP